jgi:hypothetical protein
MLPLKIPKEENLPQKQLITGDVFGGGNVYN